ncbi:hypothetical protein [Reyranella sp.]|uniref:hypothetical protein n=2 Tax=Reyranella sp. TaxID=1929291 RepID=UPI003D106D77
MLDRRRAVFFGAARDCAAHLPNVLQNLDRFAAGYAEASFLFLASDCTDDSVAILQQWLAAGRGGRVLDLGVLAPRLTRRTERLAHVRNAGLDEIRRLGWQDHDHLVIADLDDVLDSPLAADGFIQAARWLDGEPSRAGVFANALPRYYDVWALRHDRWCPHDVWHSIWGRPDGVSFEAAKFREVFSRQIEIPASAPPIEVRSAFGGLGLYRLSAALGARYGGVDAQDREVSEHVAFNTAIGRAGGRLHIFPALQVHAPRQHLYQPEEFKLPWRMVMMGRRVAEFRRPPWRSLLGAP